MAKSPTTWIAYTDGSGIDGCIGTAAWIPETGTVRYAALGSTLESTVYAAELKGMVLVLASLLKRTPGHAGRVAIMTDNQAAIRAVHSPKRPSGQYIVRKIYDLLDLLWKEGVKVSFHWIPAHTGIPGNERVNREAKAAALVNTPLPQPTELAACLRTEARRTAQQAWERAWSATPTPPSAPGTPTRNLVLLPSTKSPLPFRGMRKAWSSILIQLRTQRVGLNHFLHRIGVAESPRCTCNEGVQTPKHVILYCARFHHRPKGLVFLLFIIIITGQHDVGPS